MAERQYGILPGTGLNGTPPPTQATARRTRSPVKNIIQQRQAYSDYSSPYVDQAATDAPPTPPTHRALQPSNHRNPFTDTHAATGSTSDVSDFTPPNSRSQALRDVDNLYNPMRITPSPERRPAFTVPAQAYSPPRRSAFPHDRYSAQSTSRFATQQTTMIMQPPSAPRSLTQSPYRDRASASLNAPSLMTRQSYYQDDGYGDIDPHFIADDGDDEVQPAPRSRSRMGFGTAAGIGAAAGILGKQRDTSGQYAPVHNDGYQDSKAQISEKGRWAEDDYAARRRKRMLWIIGIIVLIAIIVGATVGGVVASRKSNSNGTSSSSSGSASSASSHSGGLYDINSAEVKSVMNNNALHKVFPGMDYTPLNAQYPDCLSNPPDQNNITLDVAIMSQLTPAIRLYGTDCNQTEMVLTAIDRLQMNNSMSVWLGVWLGTNATTNTRQLAQMYNILDKYPSSHFAGIIVGNEVLFRKDMTLMQLGSVLTDVRSNLTAKKISLPVATSDLGDNWTAGLALDSDIIMANVHPFFAGVTPDIAPGWTYNFWQSHDSILAPAKTGSWPKSIISEVGWPSEGGNDCGTSLGTCPTGQGAVASIDNMNKFMDGFVCQSIQNSTTYFWFEAFDEPWKVIYNTATDQWESKWGLMDANRSLKSGIKIPDCSGKTLSKPY